MALADPEKAAFLQGFFKTGRGQYAEGDRFLGVVVPQIRRLCREYRALPQTEAEKLLQSRYNEERLLGLLILIEHYRRGNGEQREEVCQCYLRNLRRVNNWNLVDSSAPYILGEHLCSGQTKLLDELAQSKDLWERRVAVLATLAFIRRGRYDDTLRLVELLLPDKEDLMHKACGWMLREIGKRDLPTLERFLDRHAGHMPRTMLRYAIERFPRARRLEYLRR
jgi:3-methyladenine DNA glycosylase AlkD